MINNSHLLKVLSIFLLLMLVAQSTSAQDRKDGPWWPHPLWGADDQAGASNWISDTKVLAALQWVKTGKIYELGHIYDRDMPMVGNRSFNLIIPSFPTYPPSGEQQIVFNDEFLSTQIGQVGTQFDGPGHVGRQMQMADSSVTEVFYNGYTTEEIKDPYGLKKLGIEHVKPIFTRGILIDIAALKGVETLPQNYKVSMEDVIDALKLQNMSENQIEPGDALLFNFGWWHHWPDPKVLRFPPHLTHEVTDWIIEKQPAMVGSDATLDGPGANVHTEVIMEQGIWNLEWMQFDELSADRVYKFLFIFTPLRIRGATGSPGRPIAIY